MATNSSTTDPPFLEAVNVGKVYFTSAGWAHSFSVAALDGVNLSAWAGKAVAVAGESGCGKSTLGRLLLGLIAADSGEVLFRGQTLTALSRALRKEHRKSIQMVFQNPLTSFNPMLTLGSTIIDTMHLRTDLPNRRAKVEAAKSLAGQVGLDASLLHRYPSEVSAGQLQKASIARALATQPRMIFLDEPTSALDGTSRRQIINLLLNLQQERGLGYVLVSHDFHLIGALAHHVVIMYLGQIVEEGPAELVLQHPLHPYTRALLAASDFRSTAESSWRIQGEISQLPADYRGCKLYNRCPHAVAGCQELQALFPLRPQQSVRCWRALEIENQSHDLKSNNTQLNP